MQCKLYTRKFDCSNFVKVKYSNKYISSKSSQFIDQWRCQTVCLYCSGYRRWRDPIQEPRPEQCRDEHRSELHFSRSSNCWWTNCIADHRIGAGSRA